jgi:dolichol kinase
MDLSENAPAAPPGEPLRADPHEIPYRAELKRKAIHLLALVVPLGMALLGKRGALYVLVPLSLVALAADVVRVRLAAFGRLVGLVFGPLMRPEEQPAISGPVRLNGATWVLLSAALLAAVFPIRIAVPAFTMFMIADAAAAVVGRRFGRLRWGRGRRTVEGTAAFLLAGLGVMAAFPSVVFWTGALAVLAAAAAEIPSRPFNDNLRVPLVTAAVIFALERFALGHDVPLFFGP